MKIRILKTLFLIAVVNIQSFSFSLTENQPEKYSSFVLKDSSELYEKIQWDVRVGITKQGSVGTSLSSSLSIPVHKHLRLRLLSGLVTFRGPVFAYRTERYFNEYASYGYDIENYTIGNYLAHQLSLGLEVSIPFNENITISVAPYHLRLMRSTYITKSWESYSSRDLDLRNGGVDESESHTVGAISSYNYGFQSISENDFGVQLGVGYQYKRFGLSAASNIGFTDWGDDFYFGDKRETASFFSLTMNYHIKK
jgi:hypothetical protein